MKFQIIEWTPNSSEELESFDSFEEAEEELKDLQADNNPGYDHQELEKNGGYLFISEGE